MASVQWGATATAKLVFTPIVSALGSLPAGAGTIAILWKPAGTGDDGAGLTDSGLANWYHALGWNGTHYDDGGVNVFGAATPTINHWYVSCVSWASSVSPSLERFHFIDLTAAGAWTHENSAGNNLGNRAGPGTGGWWRVGYFGDANATSGTQIALVAVWAGVNFADADAAALTTNKRTSDWYNHTAGTPTLVSEITSLTPTDLTGNSTFSGANSTTTNLTVGGNPDGGWTFDGIGGAAPAPAPRRMPLGV